MNTMDNVQSDTTVFEGKAASTSKVSVPYFSCLAVFVDRFLWDYNGKPLFKDRQRRKMDQ